MLPIPTSPNSPVSQSKALIPPLPFPGQSSGNTSQTGRSYWVVLIAHIAGCREDSNHMRYFFIVPPLQCVQHKAPSVTPSKSNFIWDPPAVSCPSACVMLIKANMQGGGGGVVLPFWWFSLFFFFPKQIFPSPSIPASPSLYPFPSSLFPHAQPAHTHAHVSVGCSSSCLAWGSYPGALMKSMVEQETSIPSKCQIIIFRS